MPNCKIGIIPPPTPQGGSDGQEQKHAMGLPGGQAPKRKDFNQDFFFTIMNLVKTRNLKTIGIRERKEIRQWGVKEKAPSGDK